MAGIVVVGHRCGGDRCGGDRCGRTSMWGGSLCQRSLASWSQIYIARGRWSQIYIARGGGRCARGR